MRQISAQKFSFLTLSLLWSCGAPKNDTACVASVESRQKSWFSKDKYLASGGFLEVARYKSRGEAFQRKGAPGKVLCTAQFQWEGNSLLAYTWNGCFEYGNVVSIQGNMFLKNGYMKIPLLHKKTREIEKYLKDARASSVGQGVAQFGHGTYLWPQNYFDLAKDVSSPGQISSNCYNPGNIPLKDFGCVSFVNMKVERFEVDESALTEKQRAFLRQHKAQVTEIKKSEDVKASAKWLLFSKNHQILNDLSSDISKAQILSDLESCGTEASKEDPFLDLLCNEQKTFLPLAKKHLLIEGRNVWDVAASLVASKSIDKPSSLKAYYEKKAQVVLREMEVQYRELLKAGESSKLEIQSNFFSNNKAELGSFAYLGVKKSNPMLKGFRWKTEGGLFQSSVDDSKSPNLTECSAHGSTLNIGKTLPLLVITRQGCKESLSMGGRPLPQYIEDEPEVVETPKPAPQPRPNPPKVKDPEPPDLGDAKPPRVVVPPPEEKPSTPPVVDSGSISESEKPSTVADAPPSSPASKDNEEPSDAEVVRAVRAEGSCR
jgi:hypothetical protein